MNKEKKKKIPLTIKSEKKKNVMSLYLQKKIKLCAASSYMKINTYQKFNISPTNFNQYRSHYKKIKNTNICLTYQENKQNIYV